MLETIDDVVKLLRQPRQVTAVSTSVCVDLMREFLRREALWARRLSIEAALPFANIPSAVVPGVDSATQYAADLSSYACSIVEYESLSNILNWLSIKRTHSSEVVNYGLPDPYAPLVQIFEFNGTFTREHRVYVDVNHQGIHAGVIQNGPLDIAFVD
ncbi:MAG: hypothetical protein JWM11_3630 [Planctomycetaceae bacterium]|nr:hypothetical protein [Planctomycetaceae bacterium]